jgi:hypothetical protein
MRATGATNRPPLELPLLSYLFSPRSTHVKVSQFRTPVRRSGRRLTIPEAAVIGSWSHARAGVGTAL